MTIGAICVSDSPYSRNTLATSSVSTSAEFHSFPNFALAFGCVVLGIGFCGEITAQSHRDRACRNFGESSGDDDRGGGHRSGESRGEREGNGEPVRHSDYDVAHGCGSCEVALNMFDGRHE